MTITSRNIITAVAATFACAAALTLTGPITDADAATYCVADQACSGISAGGDLQQALDLAQASSRVADRVEIGPGRFVKQDGFHYDSGASAANGVTIEGVPGETLLATEDGGAGGTVLTLHGTGQATSSVSGVELELSSDKADKATGLRLEQASAEHVSVTSVSGAGPFGNAGIEAKHGTRVRYADVQAPEKAAAGIRATGSKVTIEDVEVSGGKDRILFDALGSGRITRARVDARSATWSGIACLSCTDLDVDNSSVWLGGSAHGLRVVGGASGGAPDVDASHLTVVGIAPNDATAVSAVADGGHTTVRLDNSILHTVQHTLVAWSTPWTEKPAEIVVRNSNYAASKSFDAVLGTIDAAGVTSFGPSFADQAGGDFHLKSSSPLIDIGRINGLFVPSPWDLDLNDRVVDGKPGAGALPDLGAYEWHQPRQTTAAPATATPGFRAR